MFESPLAGEYHGHLRPPFIAGLDGFEVPVRSPRVDDGGHPLLDPDIHSIPEGEESIGNHHRALDSAVVFPGLPVDLLFGVRIALSPGDFTLQSFVGNAMVAEAYGVGIFRVSLEYGNFCHPHPILLAGSNADGLAVFYVENRVGRDSLLNGP